MVKNWNNCPFPKIEKSKQVKKDDLAPCRGGCNHFTKIENTTYQLCRPCARKYRFYGHSCDVPNCDSVCNGETTFEKRENKICCGACYQGWRYNDLCDWEKFVDIRHATLARPKTYERALEMGLISSVENPVERFSIAECQWCNEDKKIQQSEYQLCSTCFPKAQYYPEKCSIKGAENCPNDAINFDTDESRYVCKQCATAKRKYNISSYAIYESQIRTITECTICSKPVSHNSKNGKWATAHIDHDHETGAIRGVLCQNCNTNEGAIKNWAQYLGTDLDGVIVALKEYLENPPLTKSWAQES